MTRSIRSVDEATEVLRAGAYVGERGLATALFLALELERPILLEGEAGVGKTEVANVLASQLERRLIRLQCYEGLDVAAAVYDWNYAGQMMEIRLAEADGSTDRDDLKHDIYSERFLLRRPLLEALDPAEGIAPVLLIDELDRTDEPFEAYLLELLSDFQVTIPELGTIRAKSPPIVIITSNRTREIHDALKRRCLYHWIDYPEAERELEILALKTPDAVERLRRQVVAVIQALRDKDLFKPPGVAESIDWTRALVALGVRELTPEAMEGTLGTVLKYQDDLSRVRGDMAAELAATARSPDAG